MAANFLTTANVLVRQYEIETQGSVTLVHGSTGKLFAQIMAGAPFDIFLAADSARPAALQAAGQVAPEGRMTYALGRLALIYGAGVPAASLEAILSDGSRLAIADPALAPYGAAAAEVLRAVRGPKWRHDVVFGENVVQAFAFVATGNAGAGLVGMSQALNRPQGLRIIKIPAARYAPIRQEAVLLDRAAANPAARGFFDYLRSDSARAIIAAAGYGVTP